MNSAEFNEIMEETFEQCKNLLKYKANEYSVSSNRLHNFYRAAEFSGIGPVGALQGMLTKHIVSLYDYLDKVNRGNGHLISDSAWDEKIFDIINYMVLLRALTHVEPAPDTAGKDKEVE